MNVKCCNYANELLGIKGDVMYTNSTCFELGRSALSFTSAKEKGQVGR